MDYPKTIEEARGTTYGQRASNPQGRKYQEGRCAYEVWNIGRGAVSTQCSFKNGNGPGGLYCKVHAKKVTE